MTLLYASIQLVAQGILGPSLGSSTTPLADAMGCVSPALRLVMLVGAALSMFGWIGSDMLGTPRILFAFARDGMLPRALGAVHPRTHAPYVAIFAYAVLVVSLAVSGTFAQLAVLSELALAPLYVAGCAAAWVLARRNIAHAGPPLASPLVGAAAIVGAAGMVLVVALASRAEILGLGALLVASAAGYGAARRRIARA